MEYIALIASLLLSGSGFTGFGEGHWRWRTDNGTERSAAWRASQDFPGTIMDSGGIRLRTEIYNGTGNNETGTVGLQYRIDSTGTWTNISDIVSAHDFVMAGRSPFVVDGQPTTLQVNDPGAGMFAGGEVLVSTYLFPDTLKTGTKKEYEWCIKPTATYSLDSLYQFRVAYTGTKDAFQYSRPLPDMMIRPGRPFQGIYADSGVAGFFNRDSGWIASDGCATVPLSDGRVLWMMGDSYINHYDSLGGTLPCLFQVRNSVLVQPYNNWYWGNTATLPGYFKNNTDNNYLLWPTGGYQRGDTIYVYCDNIMNSSGGLGFAMGGDDFLAKISFPSLKVVGFDSLQHFNGINWGLGFDATESGKYIYTWGIRSDGSVGSNIYAARFLRDNPGAHWGFWNGTGWDTSVGRAAVIASGASAGVYVAKVRNKYVLVSTAFSVSCNQGTQIYSSTSDNLTGPFTTRKTLYTIPDNVLGNTPFFYGPMIHPEYINARNEILLTYDINGYGTCMPFCINDKANPDYYRPRGIRVPLGLIDSSIALAEAGKGAPAPASRPWNAEWISAPNDPGTEYGVYYFRKSITLPEKPASFIVHVSADNRYKLFVNGTLVSLGPTRSDTYFWNYETVDLSPYLTKGKNTIAALVWNEAQYRPAAQVTIRTAFIIQGDSPASDILNTNHSWKCSRDNGHQPVPGYFFAASKGEMVDMNQVVKGDWTGADFDDSAWPNAGKAGDGKLKGMSWGSDWNLVPSPLPAREMTYQRIPVLRYAVGVTVPTGFPAAKTPVTIPAHTTATLLLDQTVETNAYITLDFSGGKEAGISLGYAEALFEKDSGGRRKGNRNEVDGMEFIGRIDSLLSNGQDNQSFTTLNFRTYRYLRVIVQTKDEPLVINDLYGTFTAYPFKQTAVFNTDDPEIKQILDIGWRTARLNAFETYTDCPYYEQLQYIGDTRIQALISYYNTDDDRLARNALTQMDHSRLAEGVTRSCYPSNGTQIISTFSLWYICMLHDYWMYRGDSSFIKDKLVGERAVLDFFSKYQQPDGSVKNTPYWAFVDWAGSLAGGVNGSDGCAAIYDLQLLWAYQWAAEMEAKIGLHDLARIYNAKAEQLKATINRKYWDPVKKLYGDNIEKTGFSQHANALAIITGTAPKAEVPGICHRMLTDGSLTQCSVYFKYYLHQALIKGGLGDEYMNWLGIWRDNIKMGLTTWAEYSDLHTTRSDCHAWGSSPNIEFYRTVLGIDSDAPGFKQIKIEPHLGTLTHVSGSIPHPNGKVEVEYTQKEGKWTIRIHLPESTSGIFVWKGSRYVLKAGVNSLVI